VHCGMACMLHDNRVGSGGQTSRSGKQVGEGVCTLDTVGVAHHACKMWQLHVLCGSSGGGSVQLAGLSHITMMAGWMQVGVAGWSKLA